MFRKWQFWLGIVISLVFTYVAIRGLDLRRALEVAAQANYWWILPGVVVYFGAVWARTWRWHFLLRPIKDVSLPRLFPVVVIGYMANNVYPARAGELIRSFVLRQREEIAVSASLATILVERIFDGIVMLMFVVLSLPFAPMPDWLRQVVILGSLAFFGALVLFVAAAANPGHALVLANWAIDRVVPQRFRPPMTGIMSQFLEGLQALRSPKDVLMILVTSVVIWLLETLKYWFVMHCFDFSVPFYVLMLMNGVVNLATTIPSSPGYVGTFDAPGIKVLEGFGVSPAIATSYTVVLHAALWLPITLLGVFYMWRESISWSEFGLAAKSRDKVTGPLEY